MRNFSGAAKHASLLVLAVLFAACSSLSQTSPSLPTGASGGAPSAGRPSPYSLPKGRITPLKLLKLQAAGVLPGPVPRAVLERQLKLVQGSARPRLNARRASGTVSMWVTDTDYGYLVGENASGKKTITDINVEDQGCYYPITVKVDSSQNIWSSCEYNSDFDGSAVQEYSSAGALEHTYVGGCPPPVSECQYFYAYSFDESANSSDVFSALAFWEEEISSAYTYGAGFEWWPTDEPSATPTLISLGADCDPVCDVYYMDLDKHGNIWFDYDGYNSSNDTYGYGLAELKTPTTTPTMVTILPPGSIGFPGGVYVSHHGKVLNVTDQLARTTAQYKLPLSPGGSPFNTLGPTKDGELGLGDPVSGGFDQAETNLVFGDAYDWLDVGVVSTNKWKDVQNTGLLGPEGAAYTPSDR